MINLVKKVVKNRRFWVIFSTKTRYCSLDSLDRGTKVGFKMKYNCYTLQIQGIDVEIFGSEHGIWSKIEISTYLIKADF